jgi:hypothetical protein
VVSEAAGSAHYSGGGKLEPDQQTLQLYRRARQRAWQPEDVDWSVEVTSESLLRSSVGRTVPSGYVDRRVGGSSCTNGELAWNLNLAMMSTFLHGEFAALVAAGRLVYLLPDANWKLFAAAQASDEARHVEVFDRYLTEKIGDRYEVSEEYDRLLREIVAEQEWDLVLLGMQILVEGVALGSFGLAKLVLFESLARDIVGRVLEDEARHVAFGVSVLKGHLPELSSGEIRIRQDFTTEAIGVLRRRHALRELCDRTGLPADYLASSGFGKAFEKKGLSRLPSTLRRIGIWSEEVERSFT